MNDASEIKKETILLVDDSVKTLKMLKLQLASHGFNTLTAQDAHSAFTQLKNKKIDLIITDLKMPDIDGIEFIKRVNDNFKSIPTVMITGYPTVQTAVEAMKSGALEYIPKPFTEDELLAAIKFTLEKFRNRQMIDDELEKLTNNQFGLIGNHKSMIKVNKLIEKASKSMATVLITGESGTGKEVVARAIHYRSNLKASVFVPVNCPAIPEPLLESELFGYTKGAFTGANESRSGFFQVAEGGTLFLDEISNASLSLQAKLLRAIQSKEVCMVGSRKTRNVDVRIIAATNQDLREMVKSGKFREDLYYRLNIIPVNIPSLRERPEDILLLANYFITKFSEEYKKELPKFSDSSLKILKNYSWPGNIRELENLIQQLVVISDDNKIDVSDFPPYMRTYHLQSFNSSNESYKTIEEIEADYIHFILEQTGGNKSKAARILGIDRKTLINKVNSRNT